MDAEQQVGAVRLSAGLRGVSPPVTRRLRVAEQTSRAELHAALQVAFGWSDGHLYTFQIRGWQFGDPARAIELVLAGGGADIPLAAFGFEIGEAFLYQYNLFIPWEIDCRIEARGLIPAARLDLPRFCGRVVFQMPSVSLSLDDAPFGSDLSMRGLTPQAPEALRFSNARKNPIALEAL